MEALALALLQLAPLLVQVIQAVKPGSPPLTQEQWDALDAQTRSINQQVDAAVAQLRAAPAAKAAASA